MAEKKLAPIFPGGILLEEFLQPLGISQYRLAKATSVPPRRINEMVHGQRAITADTALRLSRFFGTTDRYWLNLQARYDLEMWRRTSWASGWKKKSRSSGKRVDRDQPIRSYDSDPLTQRTALQSSQSAGII